MPAIDWHWTADDGLAVTNDTHDLNRFLDATQQAEYLYDRVAETINVDLKEELGFLEAYDAAYRAVVGIVDMPDREAGLLVRLLLQGGGRLSKSKRPRFSKLTDEEVAAMEGAVQNVIALPGARAEPPEER